jgi:hypothetical protein
VQGEVVDREGMATGGVVDQPIASSENRVSERPANLQ